MSLFRSQLILLTLLSSILIFRLLRRELARTREREDKPGWTGAALNASSLRTRIHRLRKNYAVGMRVNPSKSSHREQVVDSIRQTIKRLYGRRISAACEGGQTQNPHRAALAD